MFNLFNFKKVVLVLLISTVFIFAYVFLITYTVKKNISNSLNDFKGNIDYAYFNPFKNNLLIKGLSYKIKNDDSVLSNIYFDKIILSFDPFFLFDEILIIENLLIADGILEINSKSDSSKITTFENNQKVLEVDKEDIKNLSRKKFVVEKINFNTDVKFINRVNELFFIHIAAVGNNISNFKNGNMQIIGSSYVDKSLFNTKLNFVYKPNFEKINYSFSVNGSIENIPSSLTKDLFQKVRLDYESLSLDSYIECENKIIDGSKIIVRLNSVDVNYKNYSTHISKFQFPINLNGSIKSINTDYSKGLEMLKDEAAKNLINILGNKFKEEYDRIENQTKNELRRLDDNLGISEIDDKIEKEYDRIEDQVKNELRRLDDNLGISEIDDKLEKKINSLKKIIFE
jgi:hypothetical protein